MHFRHDLVCAMAYEGLRSAGGARSTARLVPHSRFATEDPTLLSLHFFEAGAHEKAWAYFVGPAAAPRRSTRTS